MITVFKQHGFENQSISLLEDHNIRLWKNPYRILAIKEYRTESNFLNWLVEDQPILGELYSNLENRYKNNLYFFMILNFDISSTSVRLEINKAKKNQYVCKKHIIVKESDIDRIPFLTDLPENSGDYNFPAKFKEKLIQENKDTLASGQEKNLFVGFMGNSDLITEYYFNEFHESKDTEVVVEKLLKGGDEHEN